jgi:hypothetical protein
LIYLSVFSDVYLCQNDIGNTNILTKQFLPARMALLADYWQKIVDKTVEKWRFAEVVPHAVIEPSALRAAKAYVVE